MLKLIFFFFFDIYYIIIFIILSLIFEMGDLFFYNRYFFFFDKLRFIMIWITLWVILFSTSEIRKLSKFETLHNYLYILNFVLLFSLILSFLFKRVLGFYVIFETSFFPIFFIIISWGSASDRVISGFYLIYYTIVGSLPFFLGLIYLVAVKRSFTFFIIDYFLKMFALLSSNM